MGHPARAAGSRPPRCSRHGLLFTDCGSGNRGKTEISLPVEIHWTDGATWLRQWDGKADVVYLDSKDTYVDGHQECCLAEAQAAVEKLNPDGLILIDDSPMKDGVVTGKGGLAVAWLLSQGFKVIYHGWQILLGRLGDGYGGYSFGKAGR